MLISILFTISLRFFSFWLESLSTNPQPHVPPRGRAAVRGPACAARARDLSREEMCLAEMGSDRIVLERRGRRRGRLYPC